MRPRSTLRTGLVWVALAVGMLGIMVGSGVAVSAVSASTTASAATAKSSPVPVLEQNLNGAGRIRVALPNGAAQELVWGPWGWLCSCQGWNSGAHDILHVNGSGEFLGLNANGCGGGCGAGWPDFQVWVNLDGQWILHDTWASWGSNWLSGEGSVMSGTVNQMCGNCITWHFFPPTPIAFHNSMDVYINPCCGWDAYWLNVWYTNGNQPY